jgi:hypothetical protein
MRCFRLHRTVPSLAMLLAGSIVPAHAVAQVTADYDFQREFVDAASTDAAARSTGALRFSLLDATQPSTQASDHRLSPATEPAPAAATSAFPLPFLADEARKRGYDIPLPFGVSPIYNHFKRDITISDLRLGLNGAPPQSVSHFVNVGSRVTVDAALGKVDAFVFPFLDVYALIGYLHEKSVTSGVASVQLPGPGHATRQVSFSGETPVDGFLTGVGINAATGYKQAFASLDLNYSVSDLGFDDHFRALLISLRTGWNGKIAQVPVRLWTGVEYWDTAATAASTVTLAGGERLSFQADQGPANPVNMLFGTSVAVNQHFGLLVEYGTNFDDMQMIVGGFEVRF